MTGKERKTTKCKENQDNLAVKYDRDDVRQEDGIEVEDKVR